MSNQEKIDTLRRLKQQAIDGDFSSPELEAAFDNAIEDLQS